MSASSMRPMTASRSSRLQAGERRFVPLDGLGANRRLERRRAVLLQLVIEIGRPRPAVGPAHLVPDAVEHGLAEVGEERPLAAVLEPVQLLKHLNQGVLNKVVGIDRVAGPGGQPPGCPAGEFGDVPGDEPVERLVVAGPDARQQFDRDIGPAFADLLAGVVPGSHSGETGRILAVRRPVAPVVRFLSPVVFPDQRNNLEPRR
ncbi:MAG TPA: hypothetical protein VMM93_12630 [Vicinamibacterales bacterium]|nr:hypothetical protein [Vicinamibacterales bacterium]